MSECTLHSKDFAKIRDSGTFGGDESARNCIKAASLRVVDYPRVQCKSLQGHGEPYKSELPKDGSAGTIL